MYVPLPYLASIDEQLISIQFFNNVSFDVLKTKISKVKTIMEGWDSSTHLRGGMEA